MVVTWAVPPARPTSSALELQARWPRMMVGDAQLTFCWLDFMTSRQKSRVITKKNEWKKHIFDQRILPLQFSSMLHRPCFSKWKQARTSTHDINMLNAHVIPFPGPTQHSKSEDTDKTTLPCRFAISFRPYGEQDRGPTSVILGSQNEEMEGELSMDKNGTTWADL